MIESNSGYIGYITFIGVVENRNDPAMLHRVQVRCFHIHTDNKSLIPTTDLPWARCANNLRPKEGDHVKGYFEDGEDRQLPVITEIVVGVPEDTADPTRGFYDARSQTDLQNSPRAPQKIILPRDGSPAQIIEQTAASLYPNRLNEPFLISRLARNFNLSQYTSMRQSEIFTNYALGIPSVVTGMTNAFLGQIQNQVTGLINSLINKIPGLSQFLGGFFSALNSSPGFQKYQLPTTYTQPASAYNAKYPYNDAKVSESGHIQEVDDTPGAERIHTRHRTGTYDEMTPNGDRVERTVNNQHNITEGNKTEITKGWKQTIVEGSEQVIVRGARVVQIEGPSQITVIGNANLSVIGNLNHRIEGDYNLWVGGNMNVNVENNWLNYSGGTYGTYSQGNIELKTFGILKYDIFDQWNIKVEIGNVAIDMFTSGITNHPINLGPIHNPILSPTMSLTEGAFDGAEFSYTPTAATQAANDIQTQINNGTPPSNVKPTDSPNKLTLDQIDSISKALAWF